MKTLDWEKVRQFIAERAPVSVAAGLLQDWYYTAATVYENGAFVDDHGAYVTSYWATPGIKATMQNGDVIEVECSAVMTDEQMREHDAHRDAIKAKAKALIEAMKAKSS